MVLGAGQFVILWGGERGCGGAGEWEIRQALYVIELKNKRAPGVHLVGLVFQPLCSEAEAVGMERAAFREAAGA